MRHLSIASSSVLLGSVMATFVTPACGDDGSGLAWQRRISHSEGADHRANAVAVGSDGGLFIGAEVSSEALPPSNVPWVIALDPNGTERWRSEIATAQPTSSFTVTSLAAGSDEQLFAVVSRKTDQHYYVYDGYLSVMRLAGDSGEPLWTDALGSGRDARVLLPSDDVVVVAYTATFDNGSTEHAIALSAYRPSGEPLWDVRENPAVSVIGSGVSQGDIVVASVDGQSSLAVRRYGADGAPGEVVDGVALTGYRAEWGAAFEADPEGDLVVVYDAGDGVRLIKIDAAGALVWDVVRDLFGACKVGGLAIDGAGRIGVATALPCASVSSFDGAGEHRWTRSPGDDRVEFGPIALTPGGDLVVAGHRQWRTMQLWVGAFAR
ncbi:MAG: hypothetical protein IT385_25165 [Deltaproteobacteria bacterium]|nr:hypothetical protein [Deltaproteobacteria bacterium]